MLYLNPPFMIINGVAVFGDHEDPLQWYFAPLMPHLTVKKDPDTHVEMPQIQLIKYRGTAGNGGFLNFDVNLGIAEDELNVIASKIRQDMHLHGKPRMAPIQLEDGTVRLLLLGKQTEVPAPPPAPGSSAPPTPPPETPTDQPRFVIKMDHHAKPALYGDNQATFSVQLDQNGVTVLEEALKGQMSPIGIVYSLNFLALRPAYTVKLAVDWNRVQKHMDESFSASFMFSSVEIEKVVDELIESRVITIDVDTFLTEDQENSGVIGRRDEAVNEVKEMITETFFTSSINPIDTSATDLDKATATVQKVSSMLATGGAAGFASFGYKKIDITRIDHKTLNTNITERTTVRKNIYPQAHLSGLASVLRKPGVKLEDFIVEVDLDNPWFIKRRIDIISRGNFEEDNISSINVTVRYNGEPKNIILESSTDKKLLQWTSAFEPGKKLIRKATYSYRVSFRSGDGRERPLFLESGERVIESENLEIQPRELYGIMTVPIVALDFPWDRYSAIEIEVRYTDIANNIRMEDSYLLNKDKKEAAWKIFMIDALKDEFSYKIIYRSIDSKDVEMPWKTSTEERITLRDPFPQKRKLSIVPNVEWQKVENVFVDVTYEDIENDLSQSASFDFRETDSNPKQFSVELIDKNKQLVQFEVTMLFKDGSLIRIPPSFTMEKRVILRSDMKGHRIVTTQTDKIAFTKKNLREIKVDIRYEDAAHGLSYADAFSLKSTGEQKNFEYDYVDASASAYEYKTSYIYNNGLSRSSEWIKEKLGVITIPTK
jgi:hypothetical protein